MQDLVEDLDLKPGGGRVGVVTYSDNARKSIDIGQHTNLSSLSAAINEVVYRNRV